MSAKMTPGPWNMSTNQSPVYGSDGSLVDQRCAIFNGSKNIATVGGLRDQSTAANACAIAAVPDLIAALQGIFAQTAKHSRQWGQEAGAHAFARDPDTARAFAAGRAALAKAGAL